MSNDSADDHKAIWVGALSALGGFLTLLGAFFYIIRSYVVQSGRATDQWQALGMLAIAVGIAFAVAGMLRFALSPLIGIKPSAPAALGVAGTAPDANAALRGRIATAVLSIGTLAIVGLAVLLIIAFAVLASLGFNDLKGKLDALLTGVFSTVLPVLATWVGTVLAFYFGSENFRQAAQSTRDALSGRPGTSLTIVDVMITYDKIAKLDADDEIAAAKRPMTDIIHTMSEAATRVILFNTKTRTPIYVIRSSTPPMPTNWLTADFMEGPELKALPEQPGKTVKDYLDANQGTNKIDAQNFHFINSHATPEDALAVMARERVDDLFITEDDKKTNGVLGWVTTGDLIKRHRSLTSLVRSGTL